MMKKIVMMILAVVLVHSLTAGLPDTVVPLPDSGGYAYLDLVVKRNPDGTPVGTPASPILQTGLVITDIHGRIAGSLPLYPSYFLDPEGNGDAGMTQLDFFENGDILAVFMMNGGATHDVFFRVFHRDNTGNFTADDVIAVGTAYSNTWLLGKTIEDKILIAYPDNQWLTSFTVKKYSYITDYPAGFFAADSQETVVLNAGYTYIGDTEYNEGIVNSDNGPHVLKYINSSGDQEVCLFYTNLSGSFSSETYTEYNDVTYNWDYYDNRDSSLTDCVIEGRYFSSSGAGDISSIPICGNDNNQDTDMYVGPEHGISKQMFWDVCPVGFGDGYFLRYVNQLEIYEMDYEDDGIHPSGSGDVHEYCDYHYEYFRPQNSNLSIYPAIGTTVYSEFFRSDVVENNMLPDGGEDTTGLAPIPWPVASGQQYVSEPSVVDFTSSSRMYFASRAVYGVTEPGNPDSDPIAGISTWKHQCPSTIPTRLTEILNAAKENGYYTKLNNIGKWTDTNAAVRVSQVAVLPDLPSPGTEVDGVLFFYENSGIKLLYPEPLPYDESRIEKYTSSGYNACKDTGYIYRPGLGNDGIAPTQSAGAAQVNLANGNLFFSKELFSVSSTIPWGISLYYNSIKQGNLQRQWRHSFSYELISTLNGLVFRMPDGRDILFNVPDPSNILTDEAGTLHYYPDRKNGFDAVLSWCQEGTPGVLSDDTVSVKIGNSTEYFFNGVYEKNYISKIVDSSGNEWNISGGYNCSIVGPCGREVLCEQNTITLKVPTGVAGVTQDYEWVLQDFNYGMGNLSEIEYPGGRTVTFGYSFISNRLSEYTDESSNTWRYVYWGEDTDTGWTSISDYNESSIYEVDFLRDGKIKRVETPMPNQDVNAAKEPAGSNYAWKFLYETYDDEGTLRYRTVVRDRTNFDVAYTYNPDWCVTTIIQYTCDINEPAVTSPAAETVREIFIWDIYNADQTDNFRRLLSHTDAGGNTTDFAYTEPENPYNATQITYPPVGDHFCKAEGEITRDEDYRPSESMSYFTSGELKGLLQETTDTLGKKTEYEYYSTGDSDGSPRKLKQVQKTITVCADPAVTVPDNITVLYKYNTNGTVKEEVYNPLDPAHSYTVNYVYYDPASAVPQLNGPADYLFQRKTPNPEDQARPNPYSTGISPYAYAQRITEYEYNDFGQIVKTTYPSGAVEEWEYYPKTDTFFGMLKNHTLKNGRKKTYTYNLGAADTVYSSTCKHTLVSVDLYGAPVNPDGTGAVLLSTTSSESDYEGNTVKTTVPKNYHDISASTSYSDKTTYDPEGRQIAYFDRGGDKHSATQYYENGWPKARLANYGIVSPSEPYNETLIKYNTDGTVAAQGVAYEQDDSLVNSYTWTYFRYDNVGRKTRESFMADFAKSVDFYYNTEGWLTKQTDYEARELFYKPTYNEDGQLLIARHPANSNSADDKVTYYTYDRLGRETVPRENNVKFVKDDGGFDTEDRMYTTNYNPAGEISVTSSPDIGGGTVFTEFHYDCEGRQIETKMGTKVSLVYFNAAGDAVKREQWDSDTKRKILYEAEYDYETPGLLDWEKNGINKTVYLAYDSMGRVIKSKDASNPDTKFEENTYDKNGRLVKFEGILLDATQLNSSPVKYTEEMTYDAVGNLLSKSATGIDADSDLAQQTTYYFYTMDNLVEYTVSPLRENPATHQQVYTVIKNEYTSRRVVERSKIGESTDTDPDNAVFSKTFFTKVYDDNLQLCYMLEKRGDDEIAVRYDTDRNNVVDDYEIDRLGNILVKQGVKEERTEHYEANSSGERISSTDAAGNTTRHKSEGGSDGGRILADNVNATSVTYNSEGLISEKTDGNGNTINYSYDGLNQLDTISANGGQYVSIADRDDYGRPLEKISYNGVDPQFDVTTDIAYITDTDRVEETITSVAGKIFKIGYTYYPDGSLKNIKLPFEEMGSNIDTPYTGRKEQTRYYESTGSTAGIAYSDEDVASPPVLIDYAYKSDRISRKKLGDDHVDIDYTYDIEDRVFSVVASNGSGTSKTAFSSKTYSRKPDGRITEITDNLDSTQTFAFKYGDDGYTGQAYRLMKILKNGVTQETFNYDLMGNEQGSAQWSDVESVTDADILSWISLDEYILDGHWWRADPMLCTANSNLWADIQLITEDKTVKSFSTTVKTSPGQLYQPVLARMFFAYTDMNNYSYAGLRSKLVAVDGGDEDKVIQMVMLEIGTVESGSETILKSEQIGLDVPVNEFDLQLTPTGTTAVLNFGAGDQTGSISASIDTSVQGRAGFITHKIGGYSAKFTNVNLETGIYNAGSIMTSPLYQYSLYNGKTCQWDDNGNLTGYDLDDDGTSDILTYDAFNRLTEVETASEHVKYIYDAEGRRVAKYDMLTSQFTNIYIYHGWSVIAEYDGSGVLQREFVDGNGIDEHICMIDYTGADGSADTDGDKYYYILAHNNSVDRIVDENGDLVERYEYTGYGKAGIFDNYGAELAESSVGNPYMFQGRRNDAESGLMYFRNRQYSPEMKRFVSMDPLGFVDSMNLYETFGCDPVNYVDPWGLANLYLDRETNRVYWQAESKHLEINQARGAFLAFYNPVTGMLDIHEYYGGGQVVFKELENRIEPLSGVAIDNLDVINEVRSNLIDTSADLQSIIENQQYSEINKKFKKMTDDQLIEFVSEGSVELWKYCYKEIENHTDFYNKIITKLPKPGPTPALKKEVAKYLIRNGHLRANLAKKFKYLADADQLMKVGKMANKIRGTISVIGDSVDDFRSHVTKYEQQYLNDALTDYVKLRGTIGLLTEMSGYLDMPILSDYMGLLKESVNKVGVNLDIIGDHVRNTENELNRKPFDAYQKGNNDLQNILEKNMRENERVYGLRRPR